MTTVTISLEDAKHIMNLLAEADHLAGQYCMPAFYNPQGEAEKFLAQMEQRLGLNLGYTHLVRSEEIAKLAPKEVRLSVDLIREILFALGYSLVPTTDGKGYVPFAREEAPVAVVGYQWWQLVTDRGLVVQWKSEYQDDASVLFKPQVWNPGISNVLQETWLRQAIPTQLGLTEVVVTLPPYEAS